MSLPAVLELLNSHGAAISCTYADTLMVMRKLIKLKYTGVELERVGMNVGSLSNGVYHAQTKHLVDSYGAKYTHLDPYNCVRKSAPDYLTALQLQLILTLTK